MAKKGIVAWEGDRMQFEFESAEAVQKWIADGAKVGFTFYLGNADDSDEIFVIDEDDEEQEIGVKVLDFAADEYQYGVEGDRVFINAQVSFEADILDDVDVEAVEEWKVRGEGWYCGSIYPLDFEAEPVDDDGGSIELSLVL